MKNKSFTLIELLVVIAIIGLLTSIVLVSFKGTRGKAKIAKGLEFNHSIQHVLGAAAVGIWNFDEGSGSTSKDASGYGNNGTIYGASYVSDTPYHVVGQGEGKYALSFDGVDDYVDAGNDASLDMGINDFAITVWAKAVGGISGRGIISKGGWGSIGYSIQEAYSPANRYYFVVRDSVGYKYVLLPLYEIWDWTHIVGIKTENHLEAWVNGVKVGEYNGTIGSLSNPTKKFEIGRSFNPYYFNGTIDEVRIYNQALTAMEIQKHYAKGLARHKNLVIK